MSATKTFPYEWLETVSPSLLQLDEIPLWGGIDPFPWQKLVQQLNDLFGFESLTITPKNWLWREPNKFLEGISAAPFLYTVGLSGFEGEVILAMDQRPLRQLMAELLAPGQEINLGEVIQEDYLAGFRQFISMEILDAIVKTGWMGGLQPFLKEGGVLPEESCVTLDVEVRVVQERFTCRLIVNDALRRSLRAAGKESIGKLSNPTLANKIEIPISIQAGHVRLSEKQWATIQPGDFVILDSFALDGKGASGKLILMAHNLPLYQGRLEDGTLVLEGKPEYHEVDTTMANDEDEEDLHDEESDFDLEDDDFDFGDDDDFSEFNDEESETGLTTEEETLHEETSEEEEPVPAKEKKAKPATEGHEVAVGEGSKEKAVSATQIPLTIAVEVGRFQMTIAKMMELQPGNMLELNVHPEDGVDLVVNGRRVGRGELLRVGDVLGVRITDIGN